MPVLFADAQTLRPVTTNQSRPEGRGFNPIILMNGVFVAWGRRIKPGAKLGVVDNIDVAPTMAAMLAENLPGADGRVLREIFDAKQQ